MSSPPAAPRHRAFVGLGANVGDAPATLAQALRDLATLPGTRLVTASALYRSAPVDAPGPDFFNLVAELETADSPQALLAQLQRIEQRHGRLRPFHHAPRTLDLDLLMHGDTELETPVLTLPHPRMHVRAFVLRPLAEIAPDLVIPGRGALSGLLPALVDQPIERIPLP
ncbi:MAG TPA: 2-amino-4-hydroxy-6-hydroxymethyldihydropteridine diphosphokinase [Rubrivivax sp.]